MVTGCVNVVDRRSGAWMYFCFFVFAVASPCHRTRPYRGVVGGGGLGRLGMGLCADVDRPRSCLSNLCILVCDGHGVSYGCCCRTGCKNRASACLCGSFGGGLAAAAGRGRHFLLAVDGLTSRKVRDAACSRVNQPWLVDGGTSRSGQALPSPRLFYVT